MLKYDHVREEVKVKVSVLADLDGRKGVIRGGG